MGKIFLSYRRRNSQADAGRINDRLIKEFGPASVFLDVNGIPLGTNFINFLNQEVAACAALLAIIGEGWLEIRDENTGGRRIDDPNDYVRIEISEALARRIPIIPILLDNAEMPRPEQLPPDIRPLSSRNALRLHHELFHRDLDPLICELSQLSVFRAGDEASKSDWSLAALVVFAIIGLAIGTTTVGLVIRLAIAIENNSSGIATILLGWSAVVFALLMIFRKQAASQSLGLRTVLVWAVTSNIMLPISLVIFFTWADGPKAGQLLIFIPGLQFCGTIAFGLFLGRFLRS